MVSLEAGSMWGRLRLPVINFLPNIYPTSIIYIKDSNVQIPSTSFLIYPPAPAALRWCSHPHPNTVGLRTALVFTNFENSLFSWFFRWVCELQLDFTLILIFFKYFVIRHFIQLFCNSISLWFWFSSHHANRIVDFPVYWHSQNWSE